MSDLSRSTWRRAALAWAAVLAVGLMWPGGGGSLPFPGVDKVAHLLSFAVLAALLIQAAPAGLVRAGDRLGWAAVHGVLYGVVTEVLQGVMDAAVGWGRAAELGDGIADALGVGLGAWLGLRLGRAGAPEKESAAP